MYKIETDLKKEHTYIYGTLYEQEGIFGFVNWLSKILLLSLSEEEVPLIPADMFIFNLEICAPLVKIFKYGTDSYPWVEAMIYNFSKTFKRIWTTPNSKEWHNTEEFITPVKSKQNKKDLILTQSVIPRFNKAEVCGQCHKRIAKTPKLFPMCFQGCDIQSFPREIAKMERPESELDKPVTMEHMLNSRRSTVLVCNASCMLLSMSQMNRELYQICVFIPMHLGRKELVKECFDTMGLSDEDYQDYLTFSQDEKNNMMTRGIRQMTREIKKEIKYNNLRWIVESVYPQRHIRVVNGKLEVDTKARMKKETLLTVKSVEQVQSNPFEDCEINFAAKAKRNIPSNITDYISHLLLHSIKETSCEHTLVWGGWAKYHPVNKMEKYIEQRDEDGFSKTCIDFQLKMETCDQIDLKLMGEKNRLDLLNSFENLNQTTMHLFPLVLLEHYGVGLRDNCYKLALSGPSNLDDVAMDKVFSSSNAVLGLWGDPHFKTDGTIREYGRRHYRGVIICKSPKTYFAFFPHPDTSILNVLSHVTHMPVNTELLIELTFARKLNIVHSLGCLSKCKEFNELPEELRDNIMFMTFSLGTMDAIGRREEFERLVKGNGLCEIRFNALHLHKHHSSLNNVLYQSPGTDLVRYSPKHLIGCPHELTWTGNLIFSDNVYRHKVSGWAYVCRCLSEKLTLQKQPAKQQSPVISDREAENLRAEYEKTKAELADKQDTIKQLNSSVPNMMSEFQKCIEKKISHNTNNKQKTPDSDLTEIDNMRLDFERVTSHEFMKDFQNQNIEVLVFPCGGDYDFEDAVDSPDFMLFDLGSVPKRLVDQIKNPKNLVASALSTFEGNKPMIKHFIRFCHLDGQIYGKIIPKEHHDLYRNNFNLGMMMYDPMDFDGKTMLRQESEIFCLHVESQHRHMNSINKNTELLSTKCLWVGEMQCLSTGDQVLGFQMDKQLTDVARTDDRHAIMASNAEDIGAIRNGPILASTGHYVYSNYVAITPTRKSEINQNHELFFAKAREAGVSLVAINVDRRVIENIIGTFKKCSAVQVHAQDGFYLQTELRETKKTFLAFFLEKDEHVLDVLKISASEAAKRFWILKHDNKDDKLALYTPKEVDKMEQIWKNFCKTPMMTSHEKMFKKLRKQDRQEGVQIKTVLTKNHDPNEADIISVVAEPISLKGAVKKNEKQAPIEEKSKTNTTPSLSNVNQNLKKMFLPDSEKEKSKVGVATGGEKAEKVKICWNCHSSGDEDGVKLLKCEGCRRARYCDPECQAEDWDRHKEFCVKMQERRREKRRMRTIENSDFKIFRPDEVPPEISMMTNPEDQLEAFHKWRLEMEK